MYLTNLSSLDTFILYTFCTALFIRTFIFGWDILLQLILIKCLKKRMIQCVRVKSLFMFHSKSNRKQIQILVFFSSKVLSKSFITSYCILYLLFSGWQNYRYILFLRQNFKLELQEKIVKLSYFEVILLQQNINFPLPKTLKIQFPFLEQSMSHDRS